MEEGRGDPTGLGGHILGRYGRRKKERSETPKPKETNETLDFEVSGTDFRTAMRKNVRATALLIFSMVLISALVGYSFGAAIEIATYAHPRLDEITPQHSAWETLQILLVSRFGLIGIATMLGLSLVMVLFTFWRGDRALMYLSGARPAEPEKDALIHNLVEEMAIAAREPKPHVFVIESDTLNAFATGIRRSQACIAVTRGLAEKLNRDELQAVVAHEMGHIVNGDIRHSVALAVMVGLVSMTAALMREAGLRMLISSGRSRRSNSPLPIFLPIAILLLVVSLVAPIAAVLVKLAVSREREYLADATAVKLTRNPRALASALFKISHRPGLDAAKGATAHLFIASPEPSALSSLMATHPPIRDRINRLLALGRRTSVDAYGAHLKESQVSAKD